MPQKIIIDTDPGIDDAMAIAYAIAHPDLDLIGLTTIFGNVRVEEATANALRLLQAWGGKADVAEGAARPLVIEPHEPGYLVHGRNGFGGYIFPEPEGSAHNLDAADYMSEMTRRHPREISICAIGPLTNLGLLLERDPGVVDRVRQVVVMGGAVHRKGNVTPMAEANFWNDPHAADRVLGARWPVVLAPLDCTMPVVFAPDFLDGLAADAPFLGEPIAEMAKFYSRFYRAYNGLNGCVPHDVMALSWLTVPGAFRLQKGAVAVQTHETAKGLCMFQPAGTSSRAEVFDGRPDIDVLVDTDPRIFSADYVRTLAAYKAR